MYSFTKSVAEQVLRDEGGSIPLVIVRPSIVTPAWKEPLPGWTDNINGPSGNNLLFIVKVLERHAARHPNCPGIVAGVLTGIVRVNKTDPGLIGDIIPVEYPINVAIAAAWHRATYKYVTFSSKCSDEKI